MDAPKRPALFLARVQRAARRDCKRGWGRYRRSDSAGGDGAGGEDSGEGCASERAAAMETMSRMSRGTTRRKPRCATPLAEAAKK